MGHNEEDFKIMDIYGRHINELIDRLGVKSPTGLARLCKYGVSQPTISRVKKGGYAASHKVCCEIARILDMTYHKEVGFLGKNENNSILDIGKSTCVDYSVPHRDNSKSKRVVPMFGKIAAGEPVDTWEVITAKFSIPEHLWSENRFVLRIMGDSMEPALHDGDYVLMRFADGVPIEDCANKICAVQINGSYTIKIVRLDFNDNGSVSKITLEPINPRHPLQEVFLDKPRIAGIYVKTLETEAAIPPRRKT